MTDRPDIDALAGEYVLGTLDAAERTAVAARRQREPGLDAAITAWERRLAPLADATAGAIPPPDLFAKINARIDSVKTAANVVTLERSRNRWRAFGVAAAAATVCLGVFNALFTRLPGTPVAPQNYVAVFQKDPVSPAFVLAVDLTTHTVSIRRVAADVPAGKSYELWIAADQLGPGMHSLGLVDAGTKGLRQIVDKLEPAAVQNATFGVSLEPAGGSPTGQPTGPAFVAKLIATSP